MLGLPYHPRREYPAIPHSTVMKMDVNLTCAVNLNRKTNFYTWAAMPPEQRVASSSLQHGDEGGGTLICKFDIYLRLFAFWLPVMKLSW